MASRTSQSSDVLDRPVAGGRPLRLGSPRLLLAAVASMVVGSMVLAAVPRARATMPLLNVRNAATAVRAADLALDAFESCLDGARDELAEPVQASTMADAMRAEPRFRSCVSNDRTAAETTTHRVDSALAGSTVAGRAGRVLTQADTAGRLAMARAGAISATFPACWSIFAATCRRSQRVERVRNPPSRCARCRPTTGRSPPLCRDFGRRMLSSPMPT